MQFQVPQFIETEDTIIGSITIRQFVYMGIAGLISFVSFFFLNTTLWLIFTGFVGTIAGALAFIKYNGRPLSKIILAMFNYLWKPKMFLWRRKEELEALRAEEAAKRGSLLQNLWLRVTAGKEAIPKRADAPKSLEERYQVV